MSTYNFYFALLILYILILACSQHQNNQVAKRKYQEEKIEGNPDTIKTDYYSDFVIFRSTKPREYKYYYPNKNTRVNNGMTNERIHKSIFVKQPSLEKLKEIFNFYKLFYKNRANLLDNELTITLWFFDRKVSEDTANPDNTSSDKNFDKHFTCSFIYNFKNGYQVEDCRDCDKLDNYFFESKKEKSD